MIMMTLISAVVLSAVPGVRAASGSILDIADIPQAGDKMDAEYEFIAKFISGVTTVETFGAEWRNLGTSETSVNRNWMSVVPADHQKGQIGVRYKNVGVYNGTTLDLKITVTDWDSFYNNQSNISYSINAIGHMAHGYNYVDQKWEFVETGTDKAVAVSGYMTINDVDFTQGIKFDKATSQSISDIYVSGTDNWIQYDNTNGEYYFYEEGNKSSESYDPWAMFTFTYKNCAALQFKWMTDFNAKGSNPDRVVDTDYANGEYFGFLAKKPLATATATPHKYVSDGDEQQVTGNTLASRSEAFEYDISHTIPDEWEEFYYRNYTFSDHFPDCLDIRTVKITNLAGRDVTDWFDVQVDGSAVTADVKTEYLGRSSFYYDTYNFKIAVQIKAEADLGSYLSGDHYLFINTAMVDIDGDSARSNTVETRTAAVGSSIVKSIVTE